MSRSSTWGCPDVRPRGDQPDSEQGIQVPILILTASGRWQDKVEGLDAGADDYLVKPFHHEEMMARDRVLIRRASGWSDSRIFVHRSVSIPRPSELMSTIGTGFDRL